MEKKPALYIAADTHTLTHTDKASKALSMPTHSSHVWIDRVNNERDAYASTLTVVYVTHLTWLCVCSPVVAWVYVAVCSRVRYSLQVKHRGLQSKLHSQQPTSKSVVRIHRDYVSPLVKHTHHLRLYGDRATTITAAYTPAPIVFGGCASMFASCSPLVASITTTSSTNKQKNMLENYCDFVVVAWRNTYLKHCMPNSCQRYTNTIHIMSVIKATQRKNGSHWIYIGRYKRLCWNVQHNTRTHSPRHTSIHLDPWPGQCIGIMSVGDVSVIFG